MEKDAPYSGLYATIGPPGTGKTTFLSKQVKAIVEKTGFSKGDPGSPVLVCSLTKTAAAEVAGRDLPIPRDAIGTLHAHAFRSLGRPKVAVGEACASWNTAFPRWAFSGVGPANEDDLDEITELDYDAPGDAVRAAYDLIRHRMTPESRWKFPGLRIGDVEAMKIAEFAVEYEEWKTQTETYDFTDLISAALHSPGEVPLGAEVVVVDEAQDLSRLEWELVQKWGASAGATIAVGDPWQALYSWRGAHPELFDDERIPAGRLKTLSRSYRVPSSIVKTALAWMEGKSNTTTKIEYQPRQDADGVVAAGTISFQDRITPSNIDPLIAEVEDRFAAGRSVMIQGSCAYMLNACLSKLRDRGIPFANPWRTRRGDWNPIATRGTSAFTRLYSFLAPAAKGRIWTWGEIGLFTASIAATGVLKRGAKAELERKAKEKPDEVATSIELAAYFVDSTIFDVLKALREQGEEPGNLESAAGWIRTRLSDKSSRSFDYASKCIGRNGLKVAKDKPRVYVGTIHSFKGAEADDVFLLTELSTAARRQWDSGDPESQKAIGRTFYVAMTRARENLIVCGTSSPADRCSSPILNLIRHASERAGVR